MRGNVSTDDFGSEPGWQPARHTVFRDERLADQVHEEGFVVAPFASDSQIDDLRRLFARTHGIPRGEGGLFYSVYSRDYEYRATVDREARAILLPSFERTFVNYDNVVNMFVVKVPGPASEFPIHQDSTALDESRHSPLNCWLPLTGITRLNGPLAFARRTHRFASPYRGVSLAPPFASILPVVRRYLEPIEVPLGHAVLFDARMLHASLPNEGTEDRPVVLSGIFPAGSEIVTCYKNPAPGSPIELFRQPPEFLLRFPNFLHDCHARPVMGEVIDEVPDHLAPRAMTEETFLRHCQSVGLEPCDAMPPAPERPCHMIGEPR